MSTRKPKSTLQRISEAPAEALDRAVTSTSKVATKLPENVIIKQTKRYWHMLGPGLTTGASDDDPSGIATYSQTGAQYGFQFLWTALFTFPLMSVVQEMCARIGLVTGRGLAGTIRLYFPRKILLLCAGMLFFANALNIGANLGAMAKAVQLLWPNVSFAPVVIGFGVFSLGIQIFTDYARYARYLKWLALVLFSYIAAAILAKLDYREMVSSTLVPSLSFQKDQLFLLCAILGTTISPYLFFWQTSQEVEESILKGQTTINSRRGANSEDIRDMRVDVWSGMLLSNVVMYFIIAACGAVLFKNGVTNIESAAQAAEALRPFAGNATYWLFAVGIIGTGLLAIPVLAASSSYALSEAFRWREGLYRPLKQAYSFYGVIIISMLIGLAINFIGLDPIKALLYSAVANGLVAPVILALIVLISQNKKIMGKWANGRFTTFIGWSTTAVMTLAGLAAIYSLFM